VKEGGAYVGGEMWRNNKKAKSMAGGGK